MASYLIDTDTISQFIKNPSDALKEKLRAVKAADETVYVSEAVRYEVERGLYKKNATKQLKVFRERVLPFFSVVVVDWATWESAAQLYADATNRGRQLSDVDLINAATALRFSAVIVAHDNDYSAFPSIPTEDWINEDE